MKLSMAIVLAIALLQPAVGLAEPYVGDDFPPESVIAKNITPEMGVGKYLGKYRDGDGAYHYVCQLRNRVGLGDLRIMKLDTNLWVMENTTQAGKFLRLIEK